MNSMLVALNVHESCISVVGYLHRRLLEEQVVRLEILAGTDFAVAGKWLWGLDIGHFIFSFSFQSCIPFQVHFCAQGVSPYFSVL